MNELGWLEGYGDPLCVYQGAGRIDLDEDRIDCTFEAGQLYDGSVIVICEDLQPESGTTSFPMPSVRRLTGNISGGAQLEITGNVVQTNALGVDTSGDRVAFRARELRVWGMGGGEPTAIRFGITNFVLPGTPPRGVSFTLPIGDTRVDVRILPVAEHVLLRARLQTLKTPHVTAEVCFPVGNRDAADEMMVAVADLLSVARGTRVQWVYRDLYDQEGTAVERVHRSHVTGAYTGVAPIPDSDPRLSEFLENGYIVYRQRAERYQLRRVIDGYTEARSRGFIETRALGLAVLLETLKHAFLEGEDWEAQYFLNPAEFGKKTLLSKLREGIRTVLLGAGFDEERVKELTASGAERNLNRRPFKSIVKALAAEIDLSLDDTELRAFVRSRDVLVHQGRFWVAVAGDEELAESPYKTAIEEFRFHIYFIDRVLLRMLGHSGLFRDPQSDDPRAAARVDPIA